MCDKERDSLLCSFCVRVVDTTLILTDFSSFFKPLPKSKNTLISASSAASQQKYLRQRWYSLWSFKICTAKKQTNKQKVKTKQNKTKKGKQIEVKRASALFQRGYGIIIMPIARTTVTRTS